LLYDACSMIRTQVYIEEQTHKDLVQLAAREKKSMAAVTRDILTEGIHKRKTVDTSGVNTLRALTTIGGKSDDPYLSENVDHYLYGAPKRRP
jgi:hypothetical protein